MSVRSFARSCAGNRGRTEKGAAALEFALIAPLLLMVLLGIVSYGYMLSFRQGMSQGAAEGARAAAVAIASATSDQKSDAAVSAVNQSLQSYGVSCDNTTKKLMRDGSEVGTCDVSIAPCVNNTATSCATVDLDYAYREHALVPLPGLNVVMPSNLKYSAVAQVS